jgi:signal transduction histidine kinase
VTRFAGVSLRSRILLLVLVGAVVPLGVVGLWLNRSSERSGVALVRARLTESLGDVVAAFGSQWSRNQSVLLDLAEAAAVRSALRGNAPTTIGADSTSRRELLPLWEAVSGVAWMIEIRDLEGRPIARLPDDLGEPRSRSSPPPGFLNFDVVARERFSGEPLGTLAVQFRSDGLVAPALAPGVSGSVLAILDRRTGSSLTPLPVDPELFAHDRFEWGDEEWLSVSRDVLDPPLRFTLAAPLGPVTTPLADAARRGTLALLFAMLATFGLATLFSSRLTASLEGLSRAAVAVEAGDLDARAQEEGPPAVRELARAFNGMSGALRSTLDRLSQREALAAVGEFAASLAHEVRNPLTSIRVDLERSARKLDGDPEATRALLARALREVDRLNASVTDFLRVARSGRVTFSDIDLRAPLEAAVRAAGPRFAERGCMLKHVSDPDPVWVLGDEGALEQLVLNLLLNAADATPSGRSAGVRVDTSESDVGVTVWDEGPGIPIEVRQKLFEPFYSTKTDGTGLGLTIARRIARAHDSDLEIRSARPSPTVFRFRLRRGGTPGD